MSSLLSYISSFFYSTEEEGKNYEATFKQTKDDKLETAVVVKDIDNEPKCYTTEPIKRGYYTRYYGEYVDTMPENNRYTWEIYDYDHDTCEPKYNNIIKYLDGVDVDAWAKYIRHADTEEECNVTFQQYSDRMYYITTRDIDAGEELLIWCSEEYRDSLKRSEE